MIFFIFFYFFFNKKPIHLRGECRHQFRVLEEFKRGVDVAHENWLGVREGTHLLGEHPLHPNIEVWSLINSIFISFALIVTRLTHDSWSQAF
ncbi:hypothetical protein Hanom_Chr05g00394851 [Helianthus anomalus]